MLCSPARLIALASISSLKTVAVPCAEIKSISSAEIPAVFNAFVMAMFNSSPVRDGPLIWFASLLTEPPATFIPEERFSSDVRITVPAPSPKLIPSRVASKGLHGDWLTA